MPSALGLWRAHASIAQHPTLAWRHLFSQVGTVILWAQKLVWHELVAWAMVPTCTIGVELDIPCMDLQQLAPCKPRHSEPAPRYLWRLAVPRGMVTWAERNGNHRFISYQTIRRAVRMESYYGKVSMEIRYIFSRLSTLVQLTKKIFFFFRDIAKSTLPAAYHGCRYKDQNCWASCAALSPVTHTKHNTDLKATSWLTLLRLWTIPIFSENDFTWFVTVQRVKEHHRPLCSLWPTMTYARCSRWSLSRSDSTEASSSGECRSLSGCCVSQVALDGCQLEEKLL